MLKGLSDQPGDLTESRKEHGKILNKTNLFLHELSLVLRNRERSFLDTGVDTDESREHSCFEDFIITINKLGNVSALSQNVGIVKVEVSRMNDGSVVHLSYN